MKKKVDFENRDQLKRVEDQGLHVGEEDHLVPHHNHSRGRSERNLKMPTVIMDEVGRINAKF